MNKDTLKERLKQVFKEIDLEEDDFYEALDVYCKLLNESLNEINFSTVSEENKKDFERIKFLVINRDHQ